MARHFLGQADVSADEMRTIFERTKRLKPVRYSTEMLGKSLVMYFEKASTRTRLSFEIGMTQLGGHAVFVDPASSQLARGESLADTARVVSRYADLIMARVYAHSTVAGLAEYATVPVINGLSDLEHPCQSMADFFTIWERHGTLEGVRIAYVGDGNNNVTHSLMIGAGQLGAHITIGSPVRFQPDASVLEEARAYASKTGGSISVTDAPHEAVADADVVYSDVWVSMGHEAEAAERLELLRPFQVNEALMANSRPHCLFMHCLPAHIGDEVTADVAYGPNSVIFDEAENRLHVQKALMLFLVESSEE